jgi:hypothetical protein
MRQAKVLRLLRADAKAWWWYAQLRSQGRVAEAIELERESIRSNVRFIRQNIGRDARTIRTSIIWFDDRPTHRPFDLKPVSPWGGDSYTTVVSGCHPGSFAAWVWCYANRIGWKPRAKQFDIL